MSIPPAHGLYYFHLPKGGMGMNGVLGAGFGRPSIGKAVKVALGCSLAVLLARAMDLSTATAVVTITLLSVQRTKKDTLRAALRRSLAFLSALALALPLFSLLRFSVLSLGLFLLVFVPVCQWLNIEEGLAMSTVLMLHFWNAQTITAALVLNETILMAIGILMGLSLIHISIRRSRWCTSSLRSSFTTRRWWRPAGRKTNG